MSSMLKASVFGCMGLVIAVAACGPRQSTISGDASVESPRKPSLLRIAGLIEPQVFAPRLLFTTSPPSVQGDVSAIVNAFLVRGDERGLMSPYLAQRLPSTDDGTWVVNPDGSMRTIWTLRPDAKWQDGQPLTAHDVV